MNAMKMTTGTPVRDELVGIVQGAIDHIDDLSETCRRCITADTGFCDTHLERFTLIDQLEAFDRKLWAVKTDAQAGELLTGDRDVIAVLRSVTGPDVIPVLSRVTGLSERAVIEWLDTEVKGERAA
jgi:hypothetical protein